METLSTVFHGNSQIATRAVASKPPSAFSVSPSGNWDGNDGAWSTFTIRVGTPAQLFRILPSTVGQETWIPVPDQCERGQSWCGNARGVMPFNGASSSPYSGSPNPELTSSLDAGLSCTSSKSPMCVNCPGSVEGKCIIGPCVGRNCCGDPAGSCSGVGCNGLNGICTGAYIGCPCQGVDWNAGSNVTSSTGVLNAAAASGFQSNQSSTWSALGDYPLTTEGDLNHQTINRSLDSSGLGQYGTDVVGLGPDASTGLTFSQGLIGGILTEPYYTGILGLAPTEYLTRHNTTASLLSQLKDQNLIPSLSYGYTAGAIYRQPPVLGSLTLGGYDSSRLLSSTPGFNVPTGDRKADSNVENPAIPDSYDFQMLDAGNLSVEIQSITASNTLTSDVTILSKGVSALIDTTLPFIWLPLPACQVFETAFGLTWNDPKQLYLINDTVHQQLRNTNPSVTFSLARNSTSPSVNITLPYGAFDLQASNPIFPNGTNYFPLRRASDESQYTLGRTFFQEAYLFVNHEYSNFSISPAQFPANSEPNVVTVDYSPQALLWKNNNVRMKHKDEIIAGIVIGASLALALLLAFFLFRRSLRRKRSAQNQPSTPASTRKESWLSPSNSNSSDPLSPPPTWTSEIDGSISKAIGELEDPKSVMGQNMMLSARTPSGRRKIRQELPGSGIAKELPPDPPEREKLYELASGERSPRRTGLRVRETSEPF